RDQPGLPLRGGTSLLRRLPPGRRPIRLPRARTARALGGGPALRLGGGPPVLPLARPGLAAAHDWLPSREPPAGMLATMISVICVVTASRDGGPAARPAT